MTVKVLIEQLQHIRDRYKDIHDIVVCFEDDVVGDRIAKIDSLHITDDNTTVSILCFEEKD